MSRSSRRRCLPKVDLMKELIASMKEAVRIVAGEISPSRVHTATYLDNPFGDLGGEAGAPNGADDVRLDEAVLAEVVPVERVRPFLEPPSAEQAGAGPGEPGKGFARAVGFPEFEWLSPAYVWTDPEDARRRGDVEVSCQPTAAT